MHPELDSQLQTNVFTSKHLIGTGSFGKVYKHEGYAYKVCPLFRITSTDRHHMIVDNVIKEATFYVYLAKAKTKASNVTSEFFKDPPPSIPQADVYFQDRQIAIRLPYLGTPLSKHSSLQLNKPTIVYLFAQILQALSWLHARKWSHGDLKPGNILFNASAKVSLIDYGSLMFSARHKLSYQRCTLYYVAPEELLHYTIGPSSDIWAFGATLYEHLNHSPFVVDLMKDLKVDLNDIERFVIHVNNDDSEKPFNSRRLLEKLYTHLTYGQILSFLHKRVHDRQYRSVLAHCFILDTNIRTSANELLKTQEVFKPYAKFAVEPLKLTDLVKHPIVNIQSCSKFFYERIAHGGVDYEGRRKIAAKIVEVIHHRAFGLDDDLFLHSMMLFDRWTFRASQTSVNDQTKALNLLFSVLVTGMMLKGHTLTLEEIRDLLQTNMNIITISSTFCSFLETLEFCMLNYSPELIFETLSTNRVTDLTNQQKRQSVQTSLQLPWVHGNILTITKHIFPSLFTTPNKV